MKTILFYFGWTVIFFSQKERYLNFEARVSRLASQKEILLSSLFLHVVLQGNLAKKVNSIAYCELRTR